MDNLKTYIKSVIRELVEEESTSANVGATSTPFAFKSPKKINSSIPEIKIQPKSLIDIGQVLNIGGAKYTITRKFHPNQWGKENEEDYFDLTDDDGKVYSEPYSKLIQYVKNKNIQESIYQTVKKELLKEITYGKFKNEVSHRTKSEQLHKAIREVKRKIQEIDRIVEYTSRMKQELSESDGGAQYWKRTEDSLKQVKEMLNNVSTKLSNL